jgi:hypothetical protein
LARRADIEAALGALAPRIPPHEFAAVIDHARDSPGLRAASAEQAAWLSFVAQEIDAVLREWGVKRRVGAED